jgi:hypothetical protein
LPRRSKLGPVDIEAHDGMSGNNKPLGEARAHEAEADKADRRSCHIAEPLYRAARLSGAPTRHLTS